MPDTDSTSHVCADGSVDRHVPVTSRRKLLAGAAVGETTVAGCSGSGSAEGGGSGNWEAKADVRIRKHRTADLAVDVRDAAGNPVPDAAVDVSMRSHSFGFGTAVNAEYLIDRAGPGEEYRTTIPRLFNKAVLENHHKWGFWEVPRDRRLAEAATEWLLEHGLEMRGHTCIWQKRDQGAIPPDVVRAMETDDAERIERRTENHIEDIVGYFSDVPGVTEWDVLNEQVAEHGMTDVLNPDDPSTRACALPRWYRTAKHADPNAELYINEYNILAGDDQKHQERFETVVEYLVDSGAPLEGIGVQAHHWSAEMRRTPEQLLATLDRFAALIPSIQIHEYDTWGDSWTERMEADYLRKILKTTYSHPAVEGFLMWGFWDGIHWQSNAPLFREDWSTKPAYDVYVDLVFDEWWTDDHGRTGPDGRYSTVAVLGEYDLTVEALGDRTTETVTVDDPSGRETVELRLASSVR